MVQEVQEVEVGLWRSSRLFPVLSLTPVGQ